MARNKLSYYGDKYASRAFLLREWLHIYWGLRGWVQAEGHKPAAFQRRSIMAYSARCAELRDLIRNAPR